MKARGSLRRMSAACAIHCAPGIQAAGRLRRGCQGEDQVYGDYDVDGISSVSLVVSVLRACGADVDYYIPNRLIEGYGLSIEAIQKAADDGVALLVTADCGIGAFDEAEAAGSCGVDLIITDHHEAGASVPRCAAVVNPKRHDSDYPFKELAGVGVAFKLCQALWRFAGRPNGAADPHGYLDLVALGTIADVVPLLDENRIIAKLGLAMMGRSTLSASRVCWTWPGSPVATSRPAMSASRWPRVNAAGRLATQARRQALPPIRGKRRRSLQLCWTKRTESGRRSSLRSFGRCGTGEQDEHPSTRAIILGSEGWHSGG